MSAIFKSYPNTVNDINLFYNIYGDRDKMNKFFNIKEKSVLYKLFVAYDEKTNSTIELCVYTSKKRNINGFYRYFIYFHMWNNDNSVYIYENGFDYEGGIVYCLFKKIGFSYEIDAHYSPESCFNEMCELLNLKKIYSRFEN